MRAPAESGCMRRCACRRGRPHSGRCESNLVVGAVHVCCSLPALESSLLNAIVTAERIDVDVGAVYVLCAVGYRPVGMLGTHLSMTKM